MLSLTLEQKLECFESEWDRQSSDRLDEFIVGLTDAERLEMLSELIMIDLELRHRSGQSRLQIDQQLSEYYQRYSELTDHSVFQKKIDTHWQELQRKLQQSAFESRAETDFHTTIINADTPELAGFILPCAFGRFRLLSAIGSGGMGTVYKAEEKFPKRIVAIKILHPDFSRNEEAVARFERETQLISTIDDPRIVPVLESGVINHQHYYVMPFYRGGTLRNRIQNGKLSIRDAARLLLDLARSVAAVHKVKIVHRDLKPGNILFGEDGLPRIADFGLSRHIDHSRTLTRTGEIYGTPGYIAPERITTDNKQTDDFVADIYSLGAILYDMLCGRPPFRGATVWETLTQSLSDPPVSPTRLNPQVDSKLNTICLKCLETDPEERYLSCDDLADDLENYLQGRPIGAKRPSRFVRLRRFVKRHPAKAGFLAAGTSFIIVAFLAVVLSMELSANRKELEAQQLLRRIETYSRHLATAQQLISDRSIGWRSQSLDLLSEAARLEIPDRDLHWLRSLVATASTHRDLEPVATLAEGMWCDAVNFDPTGRFLALGQNKDYDGFQVLIYQANDLQADPYRLWIDCKKENEHRRERNQPKPEDGTREICFSPDGTRLAIGTRHGRVHVFRWDGSQAEWLESFDPDPGVEVWRLKFSADGDTLWSLSYNDQLRVIRDGKVRRFAPVGDTPVSDLAVSPTEDAVFLRIRENEFIQRFDGEVAEPTWSLTSFENICDLSLSHDGRFLSVSHDHARCLDVIETELGSTRKKLYSSLQTAPEPFSSNAYGYQDDWILSTDYDRSVTLCDIVQGQPVTSYIVPERGGRPKVTASPTEPLIAVAEHLKVTVYRVGGCEVLETVAHSPGVVRDISSNLDGSQLASLADQVTYSPEHMIDYELRDIGRNQRVLFHRVIDETGDLSDVMPIQATTDGSQLLTISSRSLAIAIPVSTVAAGSLWHTGHDELRWIPASEIEFSGISDRQQISDPQSRSESVAELILTDSRSAGLLLPKIPDAEFLNEKEHVGRSVFVVCRLESPSTSLGVQIDSNAASTVSHSTLIPSDQQEYTALWVGLHKLRYPRTPLRINLAFDQPVERLIVDGVLIRHAPIHSLVQQAVGNELAQVTEIAVHTPTGRIWAVADEEHLVIADSSEGSLVGHWENQSVSHDVGRGTLYPLEATSDWVIAGTTGGEMFVFDAETTHLAHASSPLDDRVRSLCAIPGESLVAAGGSNGVIQLLQLPSLSHRQSLLVNEHSIESLCFDAGRQWLMAGSEDGIISVFQRENQNFTPCFDLDLDLGRVQKLLYLPEEDCLAVLIRNETAVRLLHLDQLCKRMQKLGLLKSNH